MKATILGAGFAGLAAAQRCQQLNIDYAVYEKNSYSGGHAHSHAYHGFLFDEGPHISFTQDKTIQQLFADALAGQYSEQTLKTLNYWRGQYLKHPLLCHLHGLPKPLITDIIADIEQQPANHNINNFKQWCYHHQGKTFSEQFTLPYTLKYWAIDAEQLTTDWLAPRFYLPTLTEVKQGAYQEQTQNYHYIKTFRYPLVGGFSRYKDAFPLQQTINYQHQVKQIDLSNKLILFSNGKTINYDKLISSMPLPAFIAAIKNVNGDIAAAAKQLHWTSVKLINIGFHTQRHLPDAHLIYYYDQEISFARVHFPYKLSPAMAPKQQYSVQLEIYHSVFKPLPYNNIIATAMADCYRCGLLMPEDDILFSHNVDIDYANVLFTPQRQQAVNTILTYLQQYQVYCCGRYGLWDYYWSDDSIRSGWQAAEAL